MCLNTVGRSKLPISRTYLESYANMVIVGKNYHSISCTSRKVEVSPFTPDCKSTIVDAVARHDNEHTEFVEALSVSAMDINCILSHLMKDSGINMRTAPKFNQKIPLLIEENSVSFTMGI